jgi:hypothetical protein
MSAARHRAPVEDADPQTELKDDQHTEDRIFWKGALALLVTIAVAFARQRWWI